MSFKKFYEYLNDQGKGAEAKPAVDPSDDTGPSGDHAPVAPKTKGKNWDTKAPKSTGKPTPYKTPTSPEKPKAEKGGFADKGSIPVYNPNMKQGGSKNIPGGTEVEGWKTKTEAFLDQTKGMSQAEFTRYMIKECGCDMADDDSLPFVTSYSPGKFHPHPPEAIKYVVVLANKNDRVLESLLQELKKGGGLPKLMRSLVDDHPESLSALTDLFDDDEGGERRVSALVRAMSDGREKFLSGQYDEAVGPPFGLEDEEMDHEDSEDMDGMDMDDEDMGGEEGEMGTPEQGMDDMDGMDMDDEEDPSTGFDPDMDTGEEDEDDLPAPPPPPKKKKKRKRFGYQRLLDAMMMQKYMHDYMNDY